jgi:hypothetical protein
MERSVIRVGRAARQGRTRVPLTLHPGYQAPAVTQRVDHCHRNGVLTCPTGRIDRIPDMHFC